MELLPNNKRCQASFLGTAFFMTVGRDLGYTLGLSNVTSIRSQKIFHPLTVGLAAERVRVG